MRSWIKWVESETDSYIIIIKLFSAADVQSVILCESWWGGATSWWYHSLSPRRRRLLCDSGVRSELQKARMASLLPPVGTEVFRRLTPASLEKKQRGHAAEESKQANSREVHTDLFSEPVTCLSPKKPTRRRVLTCCWQKRSESVTEDGSNGKR